MVQEGPYQVDPWVIEIVEEEAEGLASDLQPDYTLELEIDLGLGRETVLDLELEMARVQVRVIDHVEQTVARSMQSPGAGRSLTWSDGPRRSGGPRSPLHSAVLGYLENW